VPTPPEAKFSLPGFAFAYATSSCTDFTGNFGFAMSSCGELETKPIIANAVAGSYGSFGCSAGLTASTLVFA